MATVRSSTVRGRAPRLVSLDDLQLAHGGHRSDAPELCLLEAVALFAGEPRSDHPRCVCPVLASFGTSLNDALGDRARQRLKPYIPQLVGTADPELMAQRVEMAGRWVLDTAVPAWLRVAGYERVAVALEARPSFVADPEAELVLEAIMTSWPRVGFGAIQTASAVGEARHGDSWLQGRLAAQALAQHAIATSGLHAAVHAGVAVKNAPSRLMRLAFSAARTGEMATEVVAVRAAASYVPLHVVGAPTVALQRAAGDETVAYPTFVSGPRRPDLAAWQQAIWPALKATTTSLFRSAMRLFDDMIALGEGKPPSR